MIVSREQKPPVGGMGGSIHDWERGLDPWHADALPSQFREVGITGARSEGWFGIDGGGNAIIFVTDGTELEDNF